MIRSGEIASTVTPGGSGPGTETDVVDAFWQIPELCARRQERAFNGLQRSGVPAESH